MEKSNRQTDSLSEIVAGIQLSRWLRFGLPSPSLGIFFASTLISELASNVVFVILLEMAYQLSERAASLGGVLVIQSAVQLFLGTFAGGFVDRMGSRKAVILGLLSQAAFTFGLALSKSIGWVFIMAGMITLARLLVTSSRLVALRNLSSKTNLPRNNSLFSMMIGLGLFSGPATAAWLLLLSAGYELPTRFAGFMLLLAVVPSGIGSGQMVDGQLARASTVFYQIQTGWRFARKNRSVWQPLICLLNSVMITAAMVPLLTPFARQISLGAEGTGYLIAAYGFGTLLGPIFAGWIFTHARLSLVLFVTGVLTPLGILFVGFLDSVVWILAALMLTGLAGSALNLVVVTVIQRVTPIDKRGIVLGAEQALIGLGWVVSSALVVGLFSFGSLDNHLRGLFVVTGITGSLLVLSCGLANRNRLTILTG